MGREGRDGEGGIGKKGWGHCSSQNLAMHW